MPRYIQYALKSDRVYNQFQKQKQGVAQLNLSLKNIGELEVPLPAADKQKLIAKTLDTASDLIAMYKQQLAELDNLIKSTFYDMFGDSLTNDKGWIVKQLNDLSLLITKGSSPTWQGINYTEDKSQVLFVTSENVREGFLDLTKSKYVENKFNELQSRSILQHGDLLINIVGASIGRATVFYLKEVANINQAVALVRCNNDVCLNYMCYYLNSPKALQMYGEMQVDVARANLSLKNIRELAILYPPMHLQKHFAEIFTKVEMQKSLVKKAIEETQYLFDSLMNKYFD